MFIQDQSVPMASLLKDLLLSNQFGQHGTWPLFTLRAMSVLLRLQAVKGCLAVTWKGQMGYKPCLYDMHPCNGSST
jgi:hypothetical protein